MTKSKRKTETPAATEARLTRWYRDQDSSEELKQLARELFQPGMGCPLITIGDEHHEKFHREDDAVRYVMVLWTDENGIESIG